LTTALLAICCGAPWSASLQSPLQQYVCARCAGVADAVRQMDVHQRWQAHIVVVQPVVCTMLRSPRAITHSQVPSDHRVISVLCSERDWAIAAGPACNDRRPAPRRLLARRRGPQARTGDARGGRARVRVLTPRAHCSARLMKKKAPPDAGSCPGHVEVCKKSIRSGRPRRRSGRAASACYSAKKKNRCVTVEPRPIWHRSHLKRERERERERELYKELRSITGGLGRRLRERESRRVYR
jgi:hypothetical protein